MPSLCKALSLWNYCFRHRLYIHPHLNRLTLRKEKKISCPIAAIVTNKQMQTNSKKNADCVFYSKFNRSKPYKILLQHKCKLRDLKIFKSLDISS